MEILKLKPVFKDYIWGGTRLTDDFGFDTGFDKTAEGWMLACHKDGMNTVEGGEFDGMPLDRVIEAVGAETLCGTHSARYPYFPVLIKLIDAHDNLSVQVHPDDAYARRVENEFGKTEAWYVLDAEEGAELVYGFNRTLDKEDFRSAIENGTLPEVLNRVKVKKGDLFFIEAGTLHAIGRGVLIAEIQQNSNCTYRVYDYGRLGKDGRPRELHIEKALDVTVTAPPTHRVGADGSEEQRGGHTYQHLTACDIFSVERYRVTDAVALGADETSFHHLLFLDGEGSVNGRPAKKGDSFLVPAGYGSYTVSGNAEFLLTKI